MQVANEGRKEAHDYKKLYGEPIPLKVCCSVSPATTGHHFA